MTLTPEQIAQWAREADEYAFKNAIGFERRSKLFDAHLVALACAWQAEQDVAICKARDTGDMTREDMEARRCAEAIRASVKGNTCQN